MRTKVSFIGLGNFGYATFYHLNRILETYSASTTPFEIWGFDRTSTNIDFLKQNLYHPKRNPELKLSPLCKFTNNYSELLENCQILVLAITSSALENVCTELVTHLQPQQKIHVLSLIKALLSNSQTPLQYIDEKLAPHLHDYSLSFLAGGMIASDLVKDEIMGATLATTQLESGQIIKDTFTSPNLRLQITTDILGTEYASALKNVISIAAGIMSGAGYSYGTVTYTISQLATECERLACSCGAHPDTFNLASQCWGNDMIMSATGATRNRELGVLIGQGQTFQESLSIMAQNKKSVEGAATLKALALLPSTNFTPYPLLNCLIQLSQDRVTPLQFFNLLKQSQP